MYKMAPPAVHSHGHLLASSPSIERSTAGASSVSRARSTRGTQVTRVSCADLASTMASFQRLTIVVAQRDRGGLRTWPPHMFRPDLVVTVNHGDEVARAVALCARANQDHGWPVLCVVMGAAHACARIDAAARASYGADVQVVVVEGR